MGDDPPRYITSHRGYARRLRYGYRRCRYCRRRLTDPHSIRLGIGPECYARHGWREAPRIRIAPPSPPAAVRPRPRRRRSSAKKRPRPAGPHPISLGGLERYVSPDALRAAAIGATCAALPVACPAITAVSTIYDASVTAHKVINATRGPGGPFAGARVAADQLWQSVVTRAASGAAGPAVRAVSLAVASSLPRSSNVAAESVRRIAAGTMTQMLTASIGSAAGYAAGAR